MKNQPDKIKEFYTKMKKLHKKSITDAEKYFNELKKYVIRLDPIKLLSQLTLTFLFVPESKYIEEIEETENWRRWIEFLAGYLVTQPYPQNANKNINGRHLEELKELLENYFKSIDQNLWPSKIYRSKADLNEELIILSAKRYSLYVRGETYKHKYFQLAEDFYFEHDKWFKENLGFTIRDAINLSKSIEEEYNKRFNEAKSIAQEEAKKFVAKLVKNGKITKKNSKSIETSTFCSLYFGNADKLLSFTADELVEFSGFPRETCQKFLERMSQPFGYMNPEFKYTYKNALKAPWDYNTLYNEKPIIHYKDKYFIFVPPLIPHVLFHTFHYDLIKDSNYEDIYNQARGLWLEKRTAHAFKKLFPQNEILLNPKYADGTELADVLILHDRKIFIIQCKAKQLTYEAKIGENIKILKRDLEKGIKDSFNQAVKARDYINNNTYPQILTSYNILKTIDKNQVTDIFLISVTLGCYQYLVTRLANINPALKLFKDKEYPWAISLFDLEIITELIDYPSQFIHYAKRRLEIEQTPFKLKVDEIGLLGFYFNQGLYFKNDEWREPDWVSLISFSEVIDRYIIEKYELKRETEKPKQKMPQGFGEYIISIEKLEVAYKTDCIMRLLDLPYQDRDLFVNNAEQTKEKTKIDGRLYTFYVVMKNLSCGFSFTSMDAKGNIEELFRTVRNFAFMIKHRKKCKEWVALGWDANSENKVDVAVFISYDWFDDPVIDQISKKFLK